MAKNVKGADIFGGLSSTHTHTHAHAYTHTQQPECRTRRVQLLFNPSLLRLADSAAERAGISRNEFIHRAVEAYLEKGDVTL